jgi:hypothetical protein
MANTSEAAAREARQARAAKAVWGLLFLTMGTLFTLENMGQINLRPEGPHPARHAVDGKPDTRWSSGWSDPQWITVDLGSVQEISRVKRVWESAFGRAYRLEVSDDGQAFTQVAEVKEGDGEVDEHDLQTRGRFVRMTGTKRSTKYGYSLWEMEVYGPWGLLSQDRSALASSGEGINLWSAYWPLLLLAGGLPALIAPKDGGDQVLGLGLAAAGAFLQLRKLDLLKITFHQAWPVALMLAGVLLVVQALRQIQRPPAPEGGAASSTESIR